MQLISKFNKRLHFLTCVINIFSKFSWVVPLKDKKGITITNAFQTILGKSGCKPNKIWVDKSNKSYNRSIKLWLQDNNIEIYAIHNERKSVVAEIFIKTLKKKIYKYIVNEYNNIYHSTIKTNPIDVNSSAYADFNIKTNDEDPKFKVGNHVRISKYKNIFSKDYTPNCSEKVFVIKKVKNTVL